MKALGVETSEMAANGVLHNPSWTLNLHPPLHEMT